MGNVKNSMSGCMTTVFGLKGHHCGHVVLTGSGDRISRSQCKSHVYTANT